MTDVFESTKNGRNLGVSFGIPTTDHKHISYIKALDIK